MASTGIVAALMLVQSASLAASPDASPAYYKAVSFCGAAKAGGATCFGMRLVRVSAHTPGARPMTQSHPGYATGPAGGFTPGDLAKAYGVNAAAPTTRTVAIVDAFNDPNALADLNAFDTHYGLPHETTASFQKLNQAGATAPLPANDAGWAGEIALDIEAVRGMCNHCKIRLYEANSASFADLGAAVNKAIAQGADIVSNSYGGPESAAANAAYDHPGKVIVASTGDHGMFDWDHVNSGGSSVNRPSSPASFNTVVAVGGTSLFLNQDATRSGETVWNQNGSSDVAGFNLSTPMGASGGGCSTVTSAKPFQSSVAKYAETTCGTKRMTGDVAALADPYTGFDVLNTFPSPGGWGTSGGTSLASPLIAAMWALAGGSGGTAYPAANLYNHFAAANRATTLYDVTAGGNGFCDGTPPGACASVAGGPPNTFGRGILDCAWKGTTAVLATGRRECDAATGYDGPSGVGTPKGLNAFKP